MSYESVRRAVGGMFATRWDFATFPLVAENQPWPSGGRQPTEKAWGRFSIRPATNVSIDVGGTSRRATGFIWLQIFVPEGKGTKPANDMADAMDIIFGQKSIGTGDSLLRTERAELAPFGTNAAGGWSQHRVLVSYMEDAVASGAQTMGLLLDMPWVTRKTGGTSTDLDAQSVVNYTAGQTVSATIDGTLMFFKLFFTAPSASTHIATPDANKHWEMTLGF